MKKPNDKNIKFLIPIIVYGLALSIDIIVTMAVYIKYGSAFFNIEMSPITSFFIKHFYFPFNLIILFAVIVIFFYLTFNNYTQYNHNKKIYYVSFILCYCISMSIIHLYGCSGGFIGGWL